MGLRAKGIALLLAALLAGVIAGWLAHDTLVTAPTDHQAIVDNMTIYDSKVGLKLTPKYVDGGLKEYAKGVPLSTYFIKGKQYQQTTWIWQRYGDTEMVMTIFGPGENGRTYSIELGRVGIYEGYVAFNGRVLFNLTEHQWNPIGSNALASEGSYFFELEVYG